MSQLRVIPEMSPEQIEHFWGRVDQRSSDECWEWTDYRLKGVYGWLSINNVSYYAHRVAYRLTYGKLGQNLCHKCDNPPCCNPNHLFEGSHKINSGDMVSKGRSARGETHARVKLTEKNVLQIRSSDRINADEAERYKVSRPQISHIRSRKNWQHI